MTTGGAQDDFYEAVKDASVAPLWRQFAGGAPTAPAVMPPHVWKWETLAPLTERAASEVPMEDVERRVLTLRNPHRPAEGPGTMKNLVGALQTLMPGETARPHRHSGNALRFVMHGHGAETLVEGKSCPMEERDFIITPVWSWHAHRHDAEGRIVWFDALDIPLYRHMGCAFFEEGPPPNLPPQIPDAAFAAGGLMPAGDHTAKHHSPLFRYPWASVLRALDALPADADGSRKVRYVNPATGGPAMDLIDCFVLSLAHGKETIPYRTTSDAICVVAEGAGSSQVGAHRIAWQRNDIFTLPAWNWISHIAADRDTKLFMVTDRDALEKLGMLRDEVKK